MAVVDNEAHVVRRHPQQGGTDELLAAAQHAPTSTIDVVEVEPVIAGVDLHRANAALVYTVLRLDPGPGALACLVGKRIPLGQEHARFDIAAVEGGVGNPCRT